MIGREIRVNITAPGSYDNMKPITPVRFPPPRNTKVRSHLIRFNPVGKLAPKGNRLIAGSVTFDRRPLRANIVAGESINEIRAVTSDG